LGEEKPIAELVCQTCFISAASDQAVIAVAALPKEWPGICGPCYVAATAHPVRQTICAGLPR
jgi:hypothetical protein